jgi:trehalose-phosphatase
MPSPEPSLPEPLPRGLLAAMARKCSLLLCLDYDGTLAELVSDPASAYPYPGVVHALEVLTSASSGLHVAIVTGRRIAEVKTLLGAVSGLFFSGVHGLEIDEPGASARFVPEAIACVDELAIVREWLRSNVPEKRGFRIEDKQVALGLHYRLADPREAASLRDRLTQLVAEQTPRLKLLHLKMLAEVMPRVASKGHAVKELKQLIPQPHISVYLGDDTTDEDAFAALDQDDIGILVGAARLTLARYRLDGPASVAQELQDLAGS